MGGPGTANPPRPCASMHVEALRSFNPFQTSKTSKQASKGKALSSPYPLSTALYYQFVRAPGAIFAPLTPSKYFAKVGVC